jgi:hypothetical protein
LNGVENYLAWSLWSSIRTQSSPSHRSLLQLQFLHFLVRKMVDSCSWVLGEGVLMFRFWVWGGILWFGIFDNEEKWSSLGGEAAAVFGLFLSNLGSEIYVDTYMKELGLRNGYLWELVRVKVWLNLDFFLYYFFWSLVPNKIDDEVYLKWNVLGSWWCVNDWRILTFLLIFFTK